jgi:hypothetical protein
MKHFHRLRLVVAAPQPQPQPKNGERVMADPESLNLDDHQPSLRQVAERLLTLTQTLSRDYRIPEELAAELVSASTRCAQAHAHVECALESLEFVRGGLDNGRARLHHECARPKHDGLDHLRPDAEGRYAWDRWQRLALEAGLDPELAALGRGFMREAVQHDWSVRLKAECGWLDGGQAMLALALTDGPAAEERWHYLLETDGERGQWTPEGDWQPLPRRES